MRKPLSALTAFAAALLVSATILVAQEILLDDFERAGGLLLFRSYADPLKYYYVPNQPRVALGDDGKPEFSFIKYARNVPSTEGEGGITEAAGGGVVHFLVEYAVPPEAVTAAEEELRELYEEAEIVGPVLFRSGRFALVTTVAAEGGRFTNKVVGLGKAPLIEGARAAVSIDLNPEGASLLWESFKMENPDISIVFDMEVRGYRKPYEATMEVDWDQVYASEKIAAGAKFFWLGGDLEGLFEELRQSGAIKLQTKGENAALAAIVQSAHAKMIELMFAKVETPPEQKSQSTDPLTAVAALLTKKGKSGGSTPLPISIYGSYKLKGMNRTGKAVFDFNHYGNESLNLVMAGNIGSLYADFGSDPGLFKAANLDDPVFKQREIFVTVDGRSEKDFADYINFVTVQIRKRHEGGDESVDEVVIDESTFKKERNRFRMVYGWKGDEDRSLWLSYEYRTVWNFRQGIQFDNDWQETDTFVINVTPPYEYRRISLEADPEVFRERLVRHALVKFYYTFFGKEIERQAVVRVKEDLAAAALEYVCEAGNYDYEYEITWYLRDNKRLQSARRRDTSEILYVDELPEEEPAEGASPGGGF